MLRPMRRKGAASVRFGGRAAWVVLVAAGLLAACSVSGSSPAGTATSSAQAGPSWAVTAAREPLTTVGGSPVSHDTEVMALASQAGRLFAATDQWEYPGDSAAGQILVKDAADAPWRVFEQTASLRVQALDSFPIPADQGLGAGHSLLVTQAVINGRSEIQWLLDGAGSFAPGDAFVLPSTAAAVRSFGAHESDGVWSVYAGVEPTGVLRGTWSPTRHALMFDPAPELTAAPPSSPALKTQKATGFADCGGALYVTINTALYRRNDGMLPPGTGRWAAVYQEPPVGAFNSGLRGLTCVTHDHAPALLVSTEGDGDVYRFDRLPAGQVDGPAPEAGQAVAGLSPVLEFEPRPGLGQLLTEQGMTVPVTGKGSIGYVIAAYNNFETIGAGGVSRQFFGIEHAYAGGCPPTRACGPTALGGAAFDAQAVYAVRTDMGGTPSYVLRALDGPDLTPAGPVSKPIRSGQAFVAIRTIKPSPFDAGRVYFAGYDANFYPADGTAWVAGAPLAAASPGVTEGRS